MNEPHNTEPRPIAPVVGSRVAIKDVIGRDDWVKNALQKMRDGNNLLINDPRRFGKTTAVRLLVEKCRSSDYETALRIDYEGISTTKQFLLRTVEKLATEQSIWSKSKGTLLHFFEGIDEVTLKADLPMIGGELKISPAQLDRDPLDILSDTLKAINRELEENVILILVLDEMPLAVRNIARSDEKQGPRNAAHLLQQLRSIRQDFASIRWVVTGSVGFHHVLNDCADTTTGVIADLMNFQAGTIASEYAEHLAECLALGIDRTLAQSSRAVVSQKTGCVPFLIQALFHTISNSNQSGMIEPVEVEAAFEKYISNTDESLALDHFLTRLDQNYPPASGRAAEKLLDTISTNNSMLLADARTNLIQFLNGVDHNNKQTNERTATELIDKLIKDHYLEKSGTRLCWRYDVLRRIWINRQGLST